ncbi:MAG: hypothetical protein H5T85_07165, partial [Actinobacteria bacterium]|nr:hypothetical protein [Actinomycetota bacterium]
KSALQIHENEANIFGNAKEKNCNKIGNKEIKSYGPKYITLDGAIKLGILQIKEVSREGSVNELVAKNKSNTLILLLDGEELVGAKQNRIINTTILLGKMSNTRIPVSCVEASRWDYISDIFMTSENILTYDIRKEKHSSVTSSLKYSRRYMSDQGQIWEKIDEMSEDFSVNSKTRAMNDIYRSFDKDLDEYICNFPLEFGQTGIFVFIDGNIAGFDNLSLPEAYSNIHTKLLRSYCIDALRKEYIRKEKTRMRPEEKKDGGKDKDVNEDMAKLKEYKKASIPSIEDAMKFMKEIEKCNESHFKSIGLGEDYRYESPYIIGSSLFYKGTVIHMAFFRDEGQSIREGRTGRMKSFRERRRDMGMY